MNPIHGFSATTNDLADETDAEFLARLRTIAEDWRFSHEFIGLVVRQRFPQKYNEDRAYPQRDWT